MRRSSALRRFASKSGADYGYIASGASSLAGSLGTGPLAGALSMAAGEFVSRVLSDTDDLPTQVTLRKLHNLDLD